MASAEPSNHFGPTRICAGTSSTYWLRSAVSRQARWMWVLSDSDLYWTSTFIRSRPELAKLERAKSMIRYRPPNGTAGLARSRVSGSRRRPSPPARIMARVFAIGEGLLEVGLDAKPARLGPARKASALSAPCAGRYKVPRRENRNC